METGESPSGLSRAGAEYFRHFRRGLLIQRSQTLFSRQCGQAATAVFQTVQGYITSCSRPTSQLAGQWSSASELQDLARDELQGSADEHAPRMRAASTAGRCCIFLYSRKSRMDQSPTPSPPNG